MSEAVPDPASDLATTHYFELGHFATPAAG
jgi:hypothetical protein